MSRLLLIDGDPAVAAAVRAAFAPPAVLDLVVAARLAQVPAALDGMPVDAVILDPAACGVSADEAVFVTLTATGGAPIFVLDSSSGGSTAAVIRAGAEECLPKDFATLVLLPRLVGNALLRRRRTAGGRAAPGRDALRRVGAALLGICEDPLLWLDRDGQVLAASAAAARLAGRPPAELVGEALEALIVGAEAPELARQLVTAIAEQRPARGVLRLGRPEAPPVTALLTPLPRDSWPETAALRLVPTGTAALRAELAEAIRAGRAAFPVGLFQLVGLRRVRERLGVRYATLRARIEALVERLMGDHLRVHDLWCRNHDGDYVVLFGRCDEAEARRRAADLEQRIVSAVLGAMDRAERRAAGRPVQAELHEVDLGPPEALTAAADLAGFVAERIGDRLADGEPTRLLQRLREEDGLSLVAARPRRELPGAPWVVPVLSGPMRLAATALGRLADREPLVVLERDLALLERITARATAVPAGPPGRILVPIAFATLARRASAARYLEAVRRLPAALGERLAFNTIELPAGVYLPTLAKLMSPLRALARWQAVSLPSLRLAPADLMSLRPALLQLDWPVLAPELHARPELLPALAAACAPGGTLLLLVGLPDDSAEAGLAAAHVDLVLPSP
jgi:PAS domain-containing protein